MARALLWCVLLVLQLGPLPGSAQTETSEDQFQQLTQRWHQTLDSIGADLRELAIDGDSLALLRENIRTVQESAEEAREESEAAAAEQQALLEALGPTPGDGEPPDDPAVATERSSIMDRLSKDRGRAARSNVVLTRARELLERAVEEETAALIGAIEQRTLSPLAPGVLVTAFGQLGDRLDELGDMSARSWRSEDFLGPWSPTAALGALALAFLIALPFRHWLLATYGPDPAIEQPSASRRFEAAMVVTFANAVLPALVILGFQLAFSEPPVVSGDLRVAVDLLLAAALEIVPLLGLAFAILAPGCPQWRISGLTDDAAIRLFRAMRAYAILLLVLVPGLVAISPVYSWGRIVALVGLRIELSALGGLVGVTLLGLAMLNLMRPRNWRYRPEAEAEDAAAQGHGHALAHTVMVLVVAGVIASMVLCAIGYVNLGVYISKAMTRTLVLLGSALGLRILLEQGLHVATSAENAVGRWLRHRLMLDDAGGARLVFWLMLIVDIVGGTVVLATILVMWGLPGAVLQDGVDLAVNGADVGGFELSLVNIGLALGVLVALLAAVRVFQRFLTDRVLVQTRLELGVRDALATGVSYVGYVLAVLITFAVLGLNIGNIALIFGALSVGIGFGLQHVVSNFVSGLILLIQRPIKTGDWIVVGDQQGYVRRISVISTEIQTFDAAAVIIPNSTMLSSQVINWHLHNKLGRVIVAVGVSYNSDPEQVRTVLLACAEQNTEILKRPAPQVVFQAFGDSSLGFELRFFLREIDNLLRVSSDMRFAIKKAFGEAGIEIPYPQRDLHIRSGMPPTGSAASEDAEIAAPPIDPATVSR